MLRAILLFVAKRSNDMKVHLPLYFDDKLKPCNLIPLQMETVVLLMSLSVC